MLFICKKKKKKKNQEKKKSLKKKKKDFSTRGIGLSSHFSSFSKKFELGALGLLSNLFLKTFFLFLQRLQFFFFFFKTLLFKRI